MARQLVTIDGNEAAAYVAHKTNEVIAIYPITPASPMGELADQWSTLHEKNIWGSVPRIIEMQAEGGAAGAVHGALQTGALTTTFTASQGLLLMLPNMYKIAGELSSTVFHIAARSIAAQALSIFGDHSDVMAARATGWAMLFANSVQEAMDFSLIAQAATLESRIPFLHIFDGFRTSHELQKIEQLTLDQIRSMISDELVRAHRARALTPDHPVMRGTAQNPDVFFQARETVNPYYLEAPAIVQSVMDHFAEATGRPYHLFDYYGSPDAKRVIIMMGSGSEAAEEAVDYLNASAQSEPVGLMKVRLFRPFAVDRLLAALPASVESIAVLDRTKEPGGIGEPLYQDVVTAVSEGIDSGLSRFRTRPLIIGGRYGLSSKEFTPSMVAGIFAHLRKEAPRNHFTVGIHDDVTNTSIDYDAELDIEPKSVKRAVFWGLGSDGTVGANKNSIKIIGESTDLHAQGYFVYDSRKSGARTISHLRFGPDPIRSTYLIRRANFVAVHQFGFMEQYDTLKLADRNATFLLNCPFNADEVWRKLPRSVQKQIIDKKLRFHVIDADQVARDAHLGGRINTVMQTCFFVLSGILPADEAVEKIKAYIRKTYGKRGEAVVRMNFAAVDAAVAHLQKVKVPAKATSRIKVPAVVSDEAPDFVRNVTAMMLAGSGDDLPVSSLPVDGTYPTGTTRWEKRNLANEIPVWDPDLCIQCGKCVMVCPHAVIRAKLVDSSAAEDAPADFKFAPASWRELTDTLYTLQVAPEDCTGCELCVEVCPAIDKSRVNRKAINMTPQRPIRDRERLNWEFFKTLPDLNRNGKSHGLRFTKAKDVQLLEPLFEFSGACAGCGETPYLSLLTRLFGDRALVANATGCSSIYGGNLPTTPWTKNRDGRGPAWSNSLFEDNAEFGLGMRLSVDKQSEYARELLLSLRDRIGKPADELLSALDSEDRGSPGGVAILREAVAKVKLKLTKSSKKPAARVEDLLSTIESLVPRSVWIVGGDGWAYDIGYGGLDHVLATGQNVNVLVLDTEVYSNTGGQASKATSIGAVAKFASGGKSTPKKDLGRLAMSYGYIYVGQVALGANENHTIKVFEEAESYDGPSLVIAYSQCIAHGINMAKGMVQQELAVDSGYWPLFRFDPRRKEKGDNPLVLDSAPPKLRFKDYAYNENRYRMLERTHPDEAAAFLFASQMHVTERWKQYEKMASDGVEMKPKPAMPPGFGGLPTPGKK